MVEKYRFKSLGLKIGVEKARVEIFCNHSPAHEEPIDTFDAQCKIHDICYDRALSEVRP